MYFWHFHISTSMKENWLWKQNSKTMFLPVVSRLDISVVPNLGLKTPQRVRRWLTEKQKNNWFSYTHKVYLKLFWLLPFSCVNFTSRNNLKEVLRSFYWLLQIVYWFFTTLHPDRHCIHPMTEDFICISVSEVLMCSDSLCFRRGWRGGCSQRWRKTTTWDEGETSGKLRRHQLTSEQQTHTHMTKKHNEPQLRLNKLMFIIQVRKVTADAQLWIYLHTCTVSPADPGPALTQTCPPLRPDKLLADWLWISTNNDNRNNKAAAVRSQTTQRPL